MPAYPVTFRKEFTIYVEAASRGEAQKSAEQSFDERHWETGEWDIIVAERVDRKPDHYLKAGEIVSVEDREEPRP